MWERCAPAPVSRMVHSQSSHQHQCCKAKQHEGLPSTRSGQHEAHANVRAQQRATSEGQRQTMMQTIGTQLLMVCSCMMLPDRHMLTGLRHSIAHVNGIASLIWKSSMSSPHLVADSDVSTEAAACLLLGRWWCRCCVICQLHGLVMLLRSAYLCQGGHVPAWS